MRFILVKCVGREEEFPEHVQYRATCPPLDIFFWSHKADGLAGAKDFIRRRYPTATFSDEEARMMDIKKITKFKTDDGVEHSTLEMAKQHVLGAKMIEIFKRGDFTDIDAQDIVNTLGSNASTVREYLDACDAMVKAAGL